MSVENGNDAEDRLTDSALFDFLCGETEERNDFNHDNRHYARHSRRWGDACVNFQPGEKVFDSNEDPDKHSLASADTSGSLETRSQNIAMEDGIKKDRDQKKNANTCKDNFCWRECLWNRYIRRNIVNREASQCIQGRHPRQARQRRHRGHSLSEQATL